MPRTNVYSEVTIANIRLAVRQVVTDFCASPERTIESVVNGQFENFVEPIQRLVLAHLEHIYRQLQYITLSPSNESDLRESVLRFLSEHNSELEKDIVQRFEKDYVSSRGHIHDDQKFRTRSVMPVNPTSTTVDVPRLENLISGDSSRESISDKHRKSAKKVQNSNSFPFSKSTYSTTSSTSNNSSLSLGDSLLQPVRGSESSRQELVLSERKSNTLSSRDVTERLLQPMTSNKDANANDEILVEIRKATDDALPVVLEKEFIASVPSVEEATIYTTLAKVKSNIPTSLCSSLRSDDDKVTVRYIPEKIPTTDAAVSTDPVFMDNQSVEKIEVGVNTVIEMASNTADGSSSSNTASDNSAGQLPKRLFDTVLQRPSLKIVSLRPDGSIVPTDNSTSQHFPSVREWTPATNKGNAEKSVLVSEEIDDIASEPDLSHSEHNRIGRLDSVSASTSRPDLLEEDLNTLANISPLPHS